MYTVSITCNFLLLKGNSLITVIILFAVHLGWHIHETTIIIIVFLDSYMIETGIDLLRLGQYVIGMNQSYFVEY